MTTIVPNWAVTDVRQSGNYDQGRNGHAITGIVIHHWGVDGQRHQDVVNFLCNGMRPNRTSAHYVASAGRVTQLVSERDRAWHCPGMNSAGIGIECHPEMTDADFETVATLIAAIRSEHGHLPLSGHQDHYPTACPGRWESQLARLSARADALLAAHNAGQHVATKTATTKTVTKATAKTKTDRQTMLTVNGQQDSATQARLEQVMGVKINGVDEPHEPAFEALQRWLNTVVSSKDMQALTGKPALDVDGIAGAATWKAFQYWVWNRRRDLVKAFMPSADTMPKWCDGIPGKATWQALQTCLNESYAGSGKLLAK